MILNAAAAILFAVAAYAANPQVLAPNNMTYSAGDSVEIKWADAQTGYINIDLVDSSPEVLQYPLNIASGVPASAGKYSWKIPPQLKTASGYKIRVWGSQPPAGESDKGISSSFTIMNALPNAVNNFAVATPSKEKPCVINTPCKITWDYPLGSNYPAQVDIALYRVGNPSPLMHIATVDSDLKSYTWNVPAEAGAIGSDVYISVSGQGQPLIGPGMGNDMGGNSRAFVVALEAPVEEKKEKIEKKKVDKKVEKEEKSQPRLAGASQKEESSAQAVKAGAVLIAAAVLVPLFLVL